MNYYTEKFGYLPLQKKNTIRMRDCDVDHNRSTALPLARRRTERIGTGDP